MTFKKWPSIENSYRQKFIDVFLTEFPELAKETFIVTEKIHGANIQFYFEPGKPYRIGSRNQWVDSSFYNVSEVLPEYEEFFKDAQYMADGTKETWRVFGELFGPKIQKGVDYGEKRRIRLFGLMINDVLKSPTLLRLSVGTFLVPVVKIIDGLQSALEFNAEFETSLGTGVCEGVVIQPYQKVYRNAGGHTFMLKIKNEAFKEKARAKKPSRPQDPELVRLNQELCLYITDARLQGVFSKSGEIQEPGQIGDYIRLMLADTKEDFLKDHSEAVEALDKKSQRKVYNVGGMIAGMLKEYL